MEILNCNKIEVKPTNYSLIISSADEQGVFDLRLKVTRQSLNKFASIMPLLIPANRKMFERVSFWLDVPVDIGYYSKDDTIDLAGKLAKFKVNGDEMICWVDGYPRAIKITVTEFVQMVNALYKSIEGRFLEPLPSVMVHAELKLDLKSFRAGGVKVPNTFTQNMMAVWDDEICVVSYYQYLPTYKTYTRPAGTHITYFRRDDVGCWTMTHTVPFFNRVLLKVSESFKAY